jgi:hypothetical protein
LNKYHFGGFVVFSIGFIIALSIGVGDLVLFYSLSFIIFHIVNSLFMYGDKLEEEDKLEPLPEPPQMTESLKENHKCETKHDLN